MPAKLCNVYTSVVLGKSFSPDPDTTDDSPNAKTCLWSQTVIEVYTDPRDRGIV